MSKRDLFDEFDIDEDTLFQDPSLFLDDTNELTYSNSSNRFDNYFSNTNKDQPGSSTNNGNKSTNGGSTQSPNYSKSALPPFKVRKQFHNHASKSPNSQSNATPDNSKKSSSNNINATNNSNNEVHDLTVDEIFDSIPDEFIDNLDLMEFEPVKKDSSKFATTTENYQQERSKCQPSNSIKDFGAEQNKVDFPKLTSDKELYQHECSKPQLNNNIKNSEEDKDEGSQISWDSLPEELFEDAILSEKPTEKPVDNSGLVWEDIPEEVEKELEATFLVENNKEEYNIHNNLPQNSSKSSFTNENMDTSFHNNSFESTSTSFHNTRFDNVSRTIQQNPNNSLEFTHNPPTEENLTHEADPSTINTWVYPTNYPVRLYQKSIVQSSLFNNTLVCLPTGLGKTFIAAVVMYNHLRWFPNSKVVFMAPTKPLVNQQMFACYDIMGIDPSLNAELTGSQSQETRRVAWQQYSVFYATPQVVKNDIESGICPWQQISCIVVDEAHRATGDFAYTVVVRKLTTVNHQFRVLGLSATPGRDLERVQTVIDNLNISKIEIRTEECLDVRQYTFTKQIQTQLVSLTPNIERLLLPFQALLSHFTGKLITKKAVFARDTIQAHQISSFALIKAREAYRARKVDRSESIPVEGEFTIAISFARAINLLITQGIKNFAEAIKSWSKSELLPAAGHSLARYKRELICMPEYANAFDTLDEVLKQDSLISHPKLQRVKDQIQSHFQSSKDQEDTRVIVFATFRDTVDDILNELQSLGPNIRATRFIGQASRKSDKGLKQSDQLKTLAHFKQGVFNVLVSTSIGEEGLDIGEVDLILCYDCNSSPIRFLQRNGRTGRKRQGKVIMFLTQGREQMSLGTSKSTHKGVVKMIQSRTSKLKYSSFNPRLLPLSCHPMCEEHQMEIKACDRSEFHNGRKRKRNNDDSCDLGQGVGYLTFSETHQFRQIFRIEPNIFSPKKAIKNVLGKEVINLENYAIGQTRLTPTSLVLHGSRSRLLARTMMHIQQLIPNREDSPDLPSIILDAPSQTNIESPTNLSIELPKTVVISQEEEEEEERPRIKTPRISNSLDFNSFKIESNSPNFSSLETSETSGLDFLSRFINPNCKDIPLCLRGPDSNSPSNSTHSITQNPTKEPKPNWSQDVDSVMNVTEDYNPSIIGVTNSIPIVQTPVYDDSYLSSDDNSIPSDKAEYSKKLKDLFNSIENVLSQG